MKTCNHLRFVMLADITDLTSKPSIVLTKMSDQIQVSNIFSSKYTRIIEILSNPFR